MKMVLAASGDSGFFGTLHDFFGSGSWPVVQNLLIFFVVVFWLAVGYWVYKDARRRIEDPWLVGAATVLGLVPPFVGAFIYMLFRPPEYLEDVRERELEMRAMEEQLAETDLHCPVCRAAVKENFLVCPVCTTKLKQACETCKQPLEPLWQVCPYCETRVATPAPIEFAPTTTTRSRRRRPAQEAQPEQRVSESPQ